MISRIVYFEKKSSPSLLDQLGKKSYIALLDLTCNEKNIFNLRLLRLFALASHSPNFMIFFQFSRQ